MSKKQSSKKPVAKKKTAVAKTPPTKRIAARAKSQVLPGMEDRAIQPLEDLAHQYASIRDERSELTRQEVVLKNDLLAQMKKLGRTTYVHDGIVIQVVIEEETIKVRIRKAEPLEDGETSDSEAAEVDKANAEPAEA